MVDHLLHPPLAERDELSDHAHEVLWDVDRDALDRLVQLAVDDARDDLRLPDRELEALSAEGLDEDSQLQLASPLHLPDLGALGRVHAKRDVADELCVEPVLQEPCRHLRPVSARQWRCVDPDRHRQTRLVDAQHRKRPGIVLVRQGLADSHFPDAGHPDDLAWTCFGRVDPLEALGDVELRDFHGLDSAVGPAPRDLLTFLDRAVQDAADSEAPDVRRRVEVRHERLERVAFFVGRRWDVRGDRREQRLEVLSVVTRVERSAGGLGVRVDDREFDLVLVGVEIQEQLIDLVHDLLRPRIGPVDLVHDEYDRQVSLQRLAEDEARLGKRSFARVDEQQHAVHHRERALDFAAEVGVPRCVDDVELDPPVTHSGVLREDRDALLALQVRRVHDALARVLVVAEHTGLPKHAVDERRLTVVDVSHDCEVPEVGARSHMGNQVWLPDRTCTSEGRASGPSSVPARAPPPDCPAPGVRSPGPGRRLRHSPWQGLELAIAPPQGLPTARKCRSRRDPRHTDDCSATLPR